MAYGDSDRARRLSGNHDTTDVSAGDMTQAIAYGDSCVDTFTGYSSWTSADGAYETIQTASEYFASSYIRDRFEDKDDKAKAHYDRGVELCRMARMGGVGVFIKSQNYRTNALNSSIAPYRSISGGSSSTDDSDLS